MKKLVPTMRKSLFLVVVLANCVICSASAIELFRYRDRAEDGRKLEYVFETDQQDVPKTVNDDKALEIAIDWMSVFYHMQVGDIESREFRIKPIPHWFFCFSDTDAGKIRRLFFVVLLPNGVVVEPVISERL